MKFALPALSVISIALVLTACEEDPREVRKRIESEADRAFRSLEYREESSLVDGFRVAIYSEVSERGEIVLLLKHPELFDNGPEVRFSPKEMTEPQGISAADGEGNRTARLSCRGGKACITGDSFPESVRSDKVLYGQSALLIRGTEEEVKTAWKYIEELSK